MACTAAIDFDFIKFLKHPTIIISSVTVLGATIISVYCRSRPSIEKKKPLLEGKVISTKNGSIQGVTLASRDGREFYAWHRIPYAKPPVGELRFVDPLPVENWDGVLDGTEYGPCCPQVDLFTEEVYGEEDCLHLNIFVPKELHDKQLKVPVIFNIHGGGFALGEASKLNPQYFMDEDVVIVTINYRLEILGFLNTGDDVVRGNMGLKDQVVALKWVNDNIEYFGGDPKQITIMGQSAGACSVHALMLSDLSKGLFQKGISQSGCANLALGVQTSEEAGKAAREVAQLFGCRAGGSQEIVEFLRKIPVIDLLKKRSHLIWKESIITDPSKLRTGLVPSIEAVKDERAFLTDLPINIIAKGNANKTPWMVGHTLDEGLMNSTAFLKNPESLRKFEDNWDDCICKAFAIDVGQESREIAGKIRDFYISESERRNLNRFEKFKKYTEMLTDAWFAFDIREAVLLQRKLSPVYMYLYRKSDLPMSYTNYNIAITGKRPFWVDDWLYSINKFIFQTLLRMDPPNYGVDHCSDGMLYMGNSGIEPGSKHYEYSKEFVKMIVDFAANREHLKFRGEKFEPCDPKSEELRVFALDSDNGRMISDPFADRFSFLSSLKFRSYHKR